MTAWKLPMGKWRQGVVRELAHGQIPRQQVSRLRLDSWPLTCLCLSSLLYKLGNDGIAFVPVVSAALQ